MASRQDLIAAAILQAKQPSVHLSSAAHVGAPLPDGGHRKSSAAAPATATAAHEPTPAPVNPRTAAAGGDAHTAVAAVPSTGAPAAAVTKAAPTSASNAEAAATVAAARAALASLPPGATASEALATGAVDLLTYVPRSGATGDRFTAALAASASSGAASPAGLASEGGSSGAPSPAPFVSRASVAKAPVGLPPSPAPPAGGGSGNGGGGGGLMGRLSTLLPGPSGAAAKPGGGDDATSGGGSGRGGSGIACGDSGRGAGGVGSASPAAARRRDDPHAAEAAHTGAVSRERARLEALRADKWLAMLRDWPAWMASEGKRTKVRDRCRKGIPEALRGAAWQAILGSPAVRDACGGPGAYRRLLSLKLKGSGGVPPAPVAEETPAAGGGAGGGTARRPVSSWGKGSGASGAPSATAAAVAAVAAHQAHQHKAAKVRMSSAAGTPPLPSVPALFAALAGATEGHAGPDVIDTIERDINRTYPQFALFSEVGGIGQTSLFRVLVAYAHLNGHVGYCQGMGFIAALFLSYMPEEEAFWAFVTVLQHEPHGLGHLFSPGLPLSAVMDHVLQGLVNRKLPTLAAHLHKFSIVPGMYATQWLLTIFCYSFPFAAVARIWDCFLFEGWKVVFRVALATLESAEPALCAESSFEGLMMTFKGLGADADADALMERTFKLNLTSAEVDAVITEFGKLTGPGAPPGTPTCGPQAGLHKL